MNKVAKEYAATSTGGGAPRTRRSLEWCANYMEPEGTKHIISNLISTLIMLMKKGRS